LADGDIRIVTANPELIYKAASDRELQQLINSADLIVADGVGVLWAARQLGHRLPERVTGIDLALRILEEANKQGWRVFLLGSKPGVAERAVINQQKKYPNIVFGCHHGYFTAEQQPLLIERIKNFAPDILLVGLGAPKQEYWNAANTGLARVRIGVGGSLDVLAGLVKRAPLFVRNLKLEWLYRLLTQPSRLKRQAILPLYVARVLQAKRRQKHCE
jgi:N-acetylglucosaminyldiphosphoundecaprenol N-acetyl-beta-D-mannosaminyltransferase